MRVVVCGGRGFSNVAFIWSKLDRIHADTPIRELMQGGATGVDSIARDWAKTKPEIKRWVCNADWYLYGNRAGPIRNKRMVNWRPDKVIAFPGGAGTANMIKQTKAAGIKVEVIEIE
jgi:hypothetical protein